MTVLIVAAVAAARVGGEYVHRGFRSMPTPTSSKTVIFSRPFSLKGVDRILPAGDYRVVTDEELIEGLSFPVYRRVSTVIFVPAQSHQASSIEMVTIDPSDLKAARDQDAATHQVLKTDAAPSSDANWAK